MQFDLTKLAFALAQFVRKRPLSGEARRSVAEVSERTAERHFQQRRRPSLHPARRRLPALQRRRQRQRRRRQRAGRREERRGLGRSGRSYDGGETVGRLAYPAHAVCRRWGWQIREWETTAHSVCRIRRPHVCAGEAAGNPTAAPLLRRSRSVRNGGWFCLGAFSLAQAFTPCLYAHFDEGVLGKGGFRPVGSLDNSPAIYRWEVGEEHAIPSRRDERKSARNHGFGRPYGT